MARAEALLSACEADGPRVAAVLSLVRQCRGGQLYDAAFGRRMRGQGAYADLIGRRFEVASRRLRLARPTMALRTDLFQPPRLGAQLSLF